MGFSYSSEAERHEKAAALEAQHRERKDARVLVANKIAMVVIDLVSNNVIRPGPMAEERECYEMSQELRDMNPQIVDLILKIIDVEYGKL